MLCENKTYVTPTYSCTGPFNSVQGTFNGFCHIITSNNEEYKGFVLNNKKNGRGKLKTKRVIYNGEWKNDQKHGKGHMCLKYNDNIILIYDGEFENDKYVSQTIKYYNSKDNSISKIYIGNVNSNYFPEDENGIFIYGENDTLIEMACKFLNGEILEYNSYKTTSRVSEYDLEWKRINNGWVLYVNFNNKINLSHVIERNKKDVIIIIFNNGDIFNGNIIKENSDFKLYQNKCNGKYVFSNKTIFNGIINYSNMKLKLESGILESYGENAEKYVMKIFDGYYHDGEIINSNNIDLKYLYLRSFFFSIYVKTKKFKINYVKIENKIITNINIEFIDSYFYNCNSGDFDILKGEQVIQYIGNIENTNNKFNGDGELYLLDGRIFSGLFVNGIFTKGTIFFPDGKKYYGEFWNGKPHGKIRVEKNNEVQTEYYLFGFKTKILRLTNLCNKFSKKIKNLGTNDQIQFDEEMQKLKDE